MDKGKYRIPSSSYQLQQSRLSPEESNHGVPQLSRENKYTEEGMGESIVSTRKAERTTPSDYGLTMHDVFRPYQRETIEYLEKLEDGKVVILQAPVGSGKSSLSCAMGV